MKIYGVTGWKNSGKTGLVTRLVENLIARGYSVSTIKHAHHSFDVDTPGRDSFQHRQAGAQEVCVASRERVAFMRELRDAPEPSLDALIQQLSPVDLVLIEGFKSGPHPKIEARRSAANGPALAPDNPTIRCVAAHGATDAGALPLFDLDHTDEIADFLLADLGLT